jgi:hypothetical protein
MLACKKGGTHVFVMGHRSRSVPSLRQMNRSWFAAGVPTIHGSIGGMVLKRSKWNQRERIDSLFRSPSKPQLETFLNPTSER